MNFKLKIYPSILFPLFIIFSFFIHIPSYAVDVGILIDFQRTEGKGKVVQYIVVQDYVLLSHNPKFRGLFGPNYSFVHYVKISSNNDVRPISTLFLSQIGQGISSTKYYRTVIPQVCGLGFKRDTPLTPPLVPKSGYTVIRCMNDIKQILSTGNYEISKILGYFYPFSDTEFRKKNLPLDFIDNYSQSNTIC